MKNQIFFTRINTYVDVYLSIKVFCFNKYKQFDLFKFIPSPCYSGTEFWTLSNDSFIGYTVRKYCIFYWESPSRDNKVIKRVFLISLMYQIIMPKLEQKYPMPPVPVPALFSLKSAVAPTQGGLVQKVLSPLSNN